MDLSPAIDLFQLSSEGFFFADKDSLQILRCNRRMVQLTGIEEESLLAMSIPELTAPEKSPALESFARKTMELGSEQTLTGFLQRADRVLFPCELKLKPVGHQWLLGAFRDISDRIRALEDIHLRNVAIANVSSGVTIADARHPDLPLIYVNSGFQQITGYSAKEAVGRSCRFLQGTDRKQFALETLRDALKKGQSCTVLLRNYRKDGTLFYNELHISPVRNDFNELTHFVGIQIDVTDRERSREILEQSEARYRLLANAVDDLIIRRSPTGRIEFASEASQGLIGIPPQDLPGKNLEELIHPSDKMLVRNHTLKIINSRKSHSISFRIAHSDGTHRWFESRDNVLEPSGPMEAPLIVSVLRDITLRRQAEMEVQQALEREKETNEMKTRFISMVSHEFRTPMTSIQASASLLRQYADKLNDEKRERHLLNIDSSLKRMNRLLNEVLFFSKAEAGKLQISKSSVELHSHLKGLAEGLRPIYPNRTIVQNIEVPKKAQFPLDVHLLDHILQNLIGNAFKYSKDDTDVHLQVHQSGDRLVFKVQDFGIGIPQSDQAKLFDAFHRASNVGATQGTGLGLNIALRAVELHGGHLSFTSVENEGSTFVCDLPAQ